MTLEQKWTAVAGRDAAMDGRFVFAVATTGIYCKPSCPARRPKRENVSFFETAAEAEGAGFRACLRCKPDAPAKVRHGVSAKRLRDAARWAEFKALLREGRDVTTALYEAGFEAPSRVYEPAGARLGMTPGEYRRGGEGLEIRYAISDGLLVAATERGVSCVMPGGTAQDLETEFPAGQLMEDVELRPLASAIMATLGRGLEALPLDLRGTVFQARVWNALRKIPRGQTRSYSEIAEEIGRPEALRAVARACATNPAALLVPCHRAVRKDGELAGYRWGLERKREFLQAEAAG